MLPMRLGERGQVAMVGTSLTLIISLIIGIIILNQLFISGAAPTQSDNENAEGYGTADAVSAADKTKSFAWVGIGLMALAIIILAAVTILGIVRGGLGGAGGV